MNKAYLLVICLLLSSLTGCLKVVNEYEEDEDNSQIDETKDESDNTIDETNNTEEKELVKGCMNSTANNYNANATEEDNTCDYDLDDDGVFDVDEILGCTNSTANNYNAEATEEDNTCDFSFQPRTRDELKTALEGWMDNSTSANSTYGQTLED